jgi:alkylation response protein AidB-like acyl-CoA dehydrogenase
MRHSLYEAGHDVFRDMARGWAAKFVAPSHAQWEKDGIVPRDVWLAGGKQGLLGFDMEAKYGGGGVNDFRYHAVLDEEMVRIGASGVGFGLHNDVIAPYLRHLATEEQKAALAARVLQR